MSNLEILNEMALLGEQPFVSSDFESESVLMFDSLSDAKSTYDSLELINYRSRWQKQTSLLNGQQRLP